MVACPVPVSSVFSRFQGMALQEWMMMCEYSNNVWMYECVDVVNVCGNEWMKKALICSWIACRVCPTHSPSLSPPFFSLSPCVTCVLCVRKKDRCLPLRHYARCFLYACLDVSPCLPRIRLHNPNICMSKVVPLIGRHASNGGPKNQVKIVDLRQIIGGFPSIFIGPSSLSSFPLFSAIIVAIAFVLEESFRSLMSQFRCYSRMGKTPAFMKEYWSVT